MKASEIAKFLNAPLIGEDLEIDGPCSLDNLQDNKVAFFKPKMLKLPKQRDALVLIANNAFFDDYKTKPSYIRVDNPRLAHALVVKEFFTSPHHRIPVSDGTHRSTLFYGSVIYDCVKYGEGCYFFPGSVIGFSGFAFERDEHGVPIRRDHLGGVVIGDNVEIGCCSTVQRATYPGTHTRIGNNVKIDSHVHFGHNCEVGDNTIIAAGVVVAGTTKIGKNCWIGIGSNIMQHITIGDNVTIGIGANVVKDVPDNTTLAGFMAQPLVKMKSFASWLRWFAG